MTAGAWSPHRPLTVAGLSFLIAYYMVVALFSILWDGQAVMWLLMMAGTSLILASGWRKQNLLPILGLALGLKAFFHAIFLTAVAVEMTFTWDVALGLVMFLAIVVGVIGIVTRKPRTVQICMLGSAAVVMVYIITLLVEARTLVAAMELLRVVAFTLFFMAVRSRQE